MKCGSIIKVSLRENGRREIGCLLADGNGREENETLMVARGRDPGVLFRWGRMGCRQWGRAGSRQKQGVER